MHEVWPVLFVAYKSKAEEVLGSLREGSLSAAIVSGRHVRRGARFVVALEDGRVLGTGEVIKVSNDRHELSVQGEVTALGDAPEFAENLLGKLKALLGPDKRPPVVAHVIPIDGKGCPFDIGGFDAAAGLLDTARKPVEAAPSKSATPAAGARRAAKSDSKGGGNRAPKALAADEDGDAELLGWIPPILAPLVTGKARADEWETIVGNALRAVGFTTEELGRTRPGEPVPDWVARFEGDSAVFKLVVDAKAGSWNAPTDAIRAMKDYVREYGGAKAYPVFVVGQAGPDVKEKLAHAMIGHRDAAVITGRQLAELIVKRLTRPELSLESEVAALLRHGRA